jgi:hypothetical protein
MNENNFHRKMMVWPHLEFYEHQGHEYHDCSVEREGCNNYLGATTNYLQW